MLRVTRLFVLFMSAWACRHGTKIVFGCFFHLGISACAFGFANRYRVPLEVDFIVFICYNKKKARRVADAIFSSFVRRHLFREYDLGLLHISITTSSSSHHPTTRESTTTTNISQQLSITHVSLYPFVSSAGICSEYDYKYCGVGPIIHNTFTFTVIIVVILSSQSPPSSSQDFSVRIVGFGGNGSCTTIENIRNTPYCTDETRCGSARHRCQGETCQAALK